MEATPQSRDPKTVHVHITDDGVTEGLVTVERNDKIVWHNQRSVNVWVIFRNGEKPVGPDDGDGNNVQNSFEVPALGEVTKKAKKKGPPDFDYYVSTSPPVEGRGPPTIRIQ